mmetsp:Transcript_71101/g.179945  ORF Transcript_71101/g.179945 Transcript_71101/m.179945 type:complete len:91 (-) Transcript_71101:198-470(-)
MTSWNAQELRQRNTFLEIYDAIADVEHRALRRQSTRIFVGISPLPSILSPGKTPSRACPQAVAAAGSRTSLQKLMVGRMELSCGKTTVIP